MTQGREVCVDDLQWLKTIPDRVAALVLGQQPARAY